MALFTAIAAGALDDPYTFDAGGAGGVPTATDDVDAAGFALTQGDPPLAALASLTDLVTGGGQLTITADFTCPDVQEVRIINNSTVTLSFGTSGCQYSGGGDAVGNQALGVLSVSGDLTNSGNGTGVNNDNGVITDFTGTLTNSGSGIAVNNYVTWTNFSGNLILASLAASAIGGNAIPFSGTIHIAAQPDLAAANILTSKTILGVAGTLDIAADNPPPPRILA